MLAEAGSTPNLVTLAAEEPGDGIAATLATHPDVRIVDFTGSSEFGDWLEANARQAVVYTEKAGLNTVVVDSTDDYRACCATWPSRCRSTAARCAPPRRTSWSRATASRPTQGTAAPTSSAPTWPPRSTSCSATRRAPPAPSARSSTTACCARLDRGRPRRPYVSTRPRAGAPTSSTRTRPSARPLVVRLDAGRREDVHPGVVRAGLVRHRHRLHRAQPAALHRDGARARRADRRRSTRPSPEVLAAAREAALDAGVHLSENLTGGVFVNQTAAFSDLHGTAANPAATAVADRRPRSSPAASSTLQSRHHAPPPRSTPMPESVYLVGGVRTPQGKLRRRAGRRTPRRPGRPGRRRGGAPRRGARPTPIDEVMLGAANQAGEDNRNVARMAVLLAGLPRHRARLHRQPALRLAA